MSQIDDVLLANDRYVESHPDSVGKAPPRKGLVALLCMDARIDPIRALGLDYGDAHILRNAGGRASDDALRSITLSTRTLGTREVMVIHHTQCGLYSEDETALRRSLDEATGQDTSDMPILSFDDLDGSVIADVRSVRSYPYLPADVVVRGFVYDVDTGALREVEVD